MYPMGVKSTQNMNKSHFFSFATIISAVDERLTECNKIKNGVIRRVKMAEEMVCHLYWSYWSTHSKSLCKTTGVPISVSVMWNIPLQKLVPPMIAFHLPNFLPLQKRINCVLTYLFQILAHRIFSINTCFFKKKNRILRAFLLKGTLTSYKEPGTFRCSRKRYLTS